jgi:hypothetical protein
MEKDSKAPMGELEKLAILSDAIGDLFPTGNRTLVFELEKEDYQKMISHFREIDRHHKQFLIEISGVEFLFMLKPEEETKVDETTEDK